MRAVMTLLSVTMAFTLFGLMIGFRATIDGAEAARPCRPDLYRAALRLCRRLARRGGAGDRRHPRREGNVTNIPGYVREPKNRAFVILADAKWPIFPDWGITQATWDMMRHDRAAL